MRNKYPSPCYRCGETVEAGDGHFERFRNAWRTQHASCAIKFRGIPDPEREADRKHWNEHVRPQWLQARAKLTGKRGQQARQQLRQLAEEAKA